MIFRLVTLVSFLSLLSIGCGQTESAKESKLDKAAQHKVVSNRTQINNMKRLCSTNLDGGPAYSCVSDGGLAYFAYKPNLRKYIGKGKNSKGRFVNLYSKRKGCWRYSFCQESKAGSL